MRIILKLVTVGVASLCALALSGWPSISFAEEEPQPAMVVIIDDIGDNLNKGLAAVHLPGPVTLAIMPHTPFGPRLASAGHQLNKEIMLHAPMENHAGKRLGPGGLTSDMDEATFKQTLQLGIASIPHVQGINNHMGSALTEMTQPMLWTMQVVADQGLFFIDSRTSANSQALSLAKQQQVASQSRDVFLDNDLAPEALQKQFNQALKIARRHGSVILIGHTYPASIEFLSENLPKLDEMGIRLVSASALLYNLQGEKTIHIKQLATHKH
ncbi:MAG: divergent polysaccharide deacetylase family protein [Gammaproteobacteria bacterium]|jgi:polysaccharide deacetylase 2 family uncharacterized protein YibQ|nr:divergent polysaccharide deacetylase family protein [Gammaproteobacteria bacterium]MCP4879977.1 divergent polysaccharide deacetylase family protein [Gammaproteobacteria bacterium]MDP6164590.1 divergent polysaccharide deacetylase family protein [Gammaproteobacteria bacterium]